MPLNDKLEMLAFEKKTLSLPEAVLSFWETLNSEERYLEEKEIKIKDKN